MDIISLLLLLRLISEGVGVAEQIAALARRIEAGERITFEEIETARNQVHEAVKKWDESASS